SLALEILCGPAEVRSAEKPPVALSVRVLLKGDILLDETWIEALLVQGVRLVGVEGLSIEEGLEAHIRLLQAGVVILEGLDLSSVPPGEYQLLCLPLKLEGGDGAPARVVLHD
ncbi:MAG: cyclase family protein, partial [Bacteroidota bacterium]